MDPFRPRWPWWLSTLFALIAAVVIFWIPDKTHWSGPPKFLKGCLILVLGFSLNFLHRRLARGKERGPWTGPSEGEEEKRGSTGEGREAGK